MSGTPIQAEAASEGALFENVMGELLAPHTPLTVVRAQNGMKLAADHVYLLPPRHDMIVADGQLLLTERDPGRGLFLPIDFFLVRSRTTRGRAPSGSCCRGRAATDRGVSGRSMKLEA